MHSIILCTRMYLDILMIRFFVPLYIYIQLRSHYLELLRRLLGSTNYSEHKHRQEDLTSCLKRIVNEHEPESQPDQEAVRAIWQAYPGVLDDTSPPE